MHLVGKDEEKFVVFYIDLLKIDTVLGAAFQHKQEKVVRSAVGKAVYVGDLGGKVAEGGGNEADGKFVVLFEEIKE